MQYTIAEQLIIAIYLKIFNLLWNSSVSYCLASRRCIQGSWVWIPMGALGFRTTIPLIKRFYCHPRFKLSVKMPRVDKKKRVPRRCEPTNWLFLHSINIYPKSRFMREHLHAWVVHTSGVKEQSTFPLVVRSGFMYNLSHGQDHFGRLCPAVCDDETTWRGWR